jgi:hypothetical protein
MAMKKHKTVKRARPKTGQLYFPKSFSLSKRQIDWLDLYVDDSSKLARQLLDDYIDITDSAQPDAVKLILRLRMLKIQLGKLDIEFMTYTQAHRSTAYERMEGYQREYKDFLEKTRPEYREMEATEYQEELERRKQKKDLAEIEYNALEQNRDALRKQIADIEAQLLKEHPNVERRTGN